MANTLGGVPPICGRKPGTKEYEVGRVGRTTLGLSFTSSLCSYCPIGRYSTTQSDREVTCAMFSSDSMDRKHVKSRE